MKYSYLHLDIQAEEKIKVYSRASFKTAKALYKNISLYSNIKMRNINVCILLQLVLNFIIANGNHQWLLCISPKSNEKELTDCAELQIAPSSVHLKIHCGVENVVPLEGNRVFKKTPRENYVVCLVIWDLPHFQRREIPELPAMRNSACISGKHLISPWQHLDHQVWWHLPCCLIVQWLLSSAAFSWSSLIGF